MKNLIIAALAATAILSVACKKDNAVVVLPEPATKNEAVSIKFDKGQTLNIDLPDRAVPNDPSTAKSGVNVNLDIVGIDLSESSRYVLYIGEKTTKASAKPQIVWMGKFKFNSGRYILDGFGDLVIKDLKEIKIIPVSTKADGAEITIPASVTAIPPQTYMLASNLARNWKISSTFIKVSGGKNEVSASRTFTGCDIHEIASFVVSKGVKISDSELDKLSGYKVKEINFIGNNSLVINFDGPESYYGTWNLSGTDFTWKLDNASNNVVAEAKGSFNMTSDSIKLVLNTTINAGDEKYTGLVELIILPVE